LRLASAECEGVTVAGASGRRGCGPQFRFFTAEAERAQAVVDASAAEIVKLEVQIERLRAASDAAIAENAATAASRRSAGRDDLARLEARSSELRAGLTSFTDDENEWVRRQLEGDLLYAPAAATLSAKLGALTQVFTKAPLILAFAVALKLLIAMLDMSATVQHLLGAPPRFTGYSQWAADARRRIQLEGELRPNVMKAAAARLDSMKQWHELNLERDAASLADHVRGRWREAVSEHDK
jgi:hypothetical protein